MHLIEVIPEPTGAERAELIAFVERVTRSGGRRPLSDHLWLDLRAGDRPGPLVARLLAEPTDRAGGTAGSAPTVALAQISAANDGSVLEVVVDPATSPDADAVGTVVDTVVDAVVDAFRSRGGGRLAWWLDDPGEPELTRARRTGLEPWRTLSEMRRPLPHEQAASVATRAFRPGRDDDAWLAVNNRAFADHGEQGGWTQPTLDLRLAEPWFDPDGLRVHEVDGRMAAFCWTKVHTDVTPVLGEIYVIAVDPDFHGRGLGRQLTLAGLDSIADRGITTANLFVDAGNTAAVAMYERLGFHIHHTRAAFAGELDPL